MGTRLPDARQWSRSTHHTGWRAPTFVPRQIRARLSFSATGLPEESRHRISRQWPTRRRGKGLPSRSSSSRTASPAAALPLRRRSSTPRGTAVLEYLRASELDGLPLLVGGRSLGAHVACRTAEATGAVAVLCLAFPLEPPRRAGKPPTSRLPELDAATVPTLVIQGERDRFGMPPSSATRKVVKVRGDHGLN